MENNKVFKGKIVSVKPNGFGFIVSPDVPFERIYFHWSGLKQSTLRFPQLKRGMQVEFEIKEIPEKGMRAIKIEVLTHGETEEGAISSSPGNVA